MLKKIPNGFYNGTEVIQLSDLDPNIEDSFVDNYGINEDGIVWVANTGIEPNFLREGDDFPLPEYEVFFATADGEVSEPVVDDSLNDGASDSTDDNIEIVPNGVYRYLNTDTGVHFYTGNEAEIDVLRDLDNFSFEGVSYLSVDPVTGQSDATSIYRFLNQNTGVHLYTISEVEREAVLELDNFSFEGEAFLGYQSQIDGSIPIYRLYNNDTDAHFYTPSIVERDAILDSLPGFQSEGIAYYAFPVLD